MPEPSDKKPPQTFRVLPLSLRLDTLGGLASPLMLRGTPLPAERVQVFSTAEDDQRAIEISILMGERPIVSKCIKVGKFMLAGIPTAPAGKPEIRVTIRVDRACGLTAKAAVGGTPLAISQDLQLELKYLRDNMVTKIREDAIEHHDEDERAVALIESTNRANRLIRQGEALLATEARKPSSLYDLPAVNKSMARVGLALDGGDPDELHSSAAALEESLRQPTVDFSDLLTASTFSHIFGSGPVRSSASPREEPASPKPSQGKASTGRQSQSPTSPVHSSTLGKIFGGGTYTLDANLCFVLMPFDPMFQAIYDDHIKPSVAAAGLKCQRADEINGVNVITTDIWEKINRARFVIADLTQRNPNVFYEVGLAHAIGKDVLLLTQSMNDVPFDLRAIRCLVYEYTPRGMSAFSGRFRATIDAIVKSASID